MAKTHPQKAFLGMLVVAIIVGGLYLGAVIGLENLQTTTAAQRWNFTLPNNQPEASSPTVSNGLVYVTTGEGGNMYCLNASNGSIVWILAKSPYFTLTNEFLYFGEQVQQSEGSSVYHGFVYCLKASDGDQIWTYTYGTSFGNPVVVVGDIAYAIGQNNTAPTSTATENASGFVFAFNASNGKTVWNQTIGGFTDFIIPSGDLLLIGYQFENYLAGLYHGEGVWALNSSNGAKLWNFPAGNSLNQIQNAAALISDGKIIVSYNNYTTTSPNVTGGGVFALDISTGSLLWTYKTADVVNSLIASNSRCFIVSQNQVYALNAQNGKLLWYYSARFNLGSPLLVNSYLYVGSPTGVFCFNANNGDLIWNYQASNYTYNLGYLPSDENSSAVNPTYANGVIYFGWNGPNSYSPITRHDFYAINALNGVEMWSYPLEYTYVSSSAVNGTVYVSGDFITSKSPDFPGTGAVIALHPNATFLLITSLISDLIIPLEIALIILIITTAIIEILILKSKNQTATARVCTVGNRAFALSVLSVALILSCPVRGGKLFLSRFL